ncbi:MAG: hypothetical protein EHM37_23035 [Deltaproteobacteria bacterium]|nr:MAG: hypothetical protein EHM37_23035 [Deltaproteobacteria bacterium]
MDPNGNLLSQCDISAFSNDPRDIAFIPTSGRFAIADAGDNEVYQIDSSCNLLGRLDTATFGINTSVLTGIAYSSASGDTALTDSNRDAVLFVNPARPGRLKSQLSTAAVGSASPSGLTFFPQATGLFAVVDDSADEVFIVNASGSLMGRFDTALVLTATVPSGIAYNPTNLTLAITDNNSDQVKILSFPILNNFAEFCDCDLNKDGSCNILDYQRFIQDWGRSNCP